MTESLFESDVREFMWKLKARMGTLHDPVTPEESCLYGMLNKLSVQCSDAITAHLACRRAAIKEA